MESERLDLLFAVLASAPRRRMLDLVMATPGMSVKALASHFEMSRVAVLTHVRQLEAAELLLTRKQGRVRQLFFNPVPLQAIHERWSTRYGELWASRMLDVKARVEDRAQGRENRSA